MLTITIPGKELFNEDTCEFVYTKETTLQLEHSLVSLSKWESKWNKPFLNESGISIEETKDYIRCMTITKNVDPEVYNNIDMDTLDKVRKYIEAPMTATWFHEEKKEGKAKKKAEEAVTAEIIYYWMIALQIPFECQRWHLNRLLTLIQVCNIKNAPPKKMSKKEILSNNRALNAARCKALGTKG